MNTEDLKLVKRVMRWYDIAAISAWILAALAFIVFFAFFFSPASASITARNVSSDFIIWDVPGETNVTVDGVFMAVNATDTPVVSLYGLEPETPHYISNSTTTVTTWTEATSTAWVTPWLILMGIFIFIGIGSRIPLLLIFPVFLSTASIVAYLPTLPSDPYLFPAYYLSLAVSFFAGWWGMRR